MVSVHQHLDRNHDTWSTLEAADTPTVTQEKEPATTIILVTIDATTTASTSSALLSHQGTDHLPISLSTLGRQTLDFGLKTIGLLAKLVVQIMMTSLSATFHCS